MKTFEELQDSAFIYPRHNCCDAARFNLVPPSVDTGWVELEVGRGKISAYPSWHVAFEDGLMDIRYCPFCGERLPRTEEDAAP